MNITLTVPEGSTNHGNPKLLCTPPQRYDYFAFYTVNYFLHTATVISQPGQGPWDYALVVFVALLYPFSAITTAVRTIRYHPMLFKDPVKRAARAGALVVVVNNNLKMDSEAADAATNEPLIPRAWWNPKYYDTQLNMGDFNSSDFLHGECRLPYRYELAFVPKQAPAAKPGANPRCIRDLSLSSVYNFPKALISLIQAVWASITMYRARGDQIDQFGYAAFGLTVAPYAYMSIINLIAQFLKPQYPSLFLLRTPVMDAAERDGGRFTQAINADLGDPAWISPRQARDRFRIPTSVVSLLVSVVPLILVAVLSSFHTGESTPLQRGFTMSWLVVGMLVGPILGPARAGGPVMSSLILVAAPAIGGMVVVGQMIRSFGVCVLL